VGTEATARRQSSYRCTVVLEENDAQVVVTIPSWTLSARITLLFGASAFSAFVALTFSRPQAPLWLHAFSIVMALLLVAAPCWQGASVRISLSKDGGGLATRLGIQNCRIPVNGGSEIWVCIEEPGWAWLHFGSGLPGVAAPLGTEEIGVLRRFGVRITRAKEREHEDTERYGLSLVGFLNGLIVPAMIATVFEHVLALDLEAGRVLELAEGDRVVKFGLLLLSAPVVALLAFKVPRGSGRKWYLEPYLGAVPVARGTAVPPDSRKLRAWLSGGVVAASSFFVFHLGAQGQTALDAFAGAALGAFTALFAGRIGKAGDRIKWWLGGVRVGVLVVLASWLGHHFL
jgi:hypothetical protein